MFGKLFRKRAPTSHLVVYVLSEIVDGNAKASPIGKAPRLTQAEEAGLNQRHGPGDYAYANENLGSVEVTLCWWNGKVDALAVLRREDATRIRGYAALPQEALIQLDNHLNHFPR